MTEEQEHRRKDFLLGIDAGINAFTLAPNEKLDIPLARTYVKDWNKTDWIDLKAELRNQLSVWVEKYLYNIQQYESQTSQRKSSISEYSFTLLKDIKRVLRENGITK